jgi:hypothetical protein
MTSDPAGTSSGWFGVRGVFRTAPDIYEERVTLWRADSLDQAIELAEAEAREYVAGSDAQWCGLVQAYRLSDDPQAQGAEVFSLMRTSDLEPSAYLDRFFDTGAERQQHG